PATRSPRPSRTTASTPTPPTPAPRNPARPHELGVTFGAIGRFLTPSSGVRSGRMEFVGRLLLWDVDGTLIRSGGVGRRVMEPAAPRAGQLREVPDVVMSGKT